MAHCGARLACPNRCECGEQVKAEHDAQQATSAARTGRVGENSGAVGSWAIRALLGRQNETRSR